ncbi:16S rRNA (cytidine(1402)-2'-O)-methyltransferase [uncultured Odoribacter sp.]|uniref:16S rRNA (cytidine(1402)-2'-O)-methyltransferase n=1 Tax=uncultured Odoribacter sp. TaxID=876416 RepID=UPI002636349C|nr:16S rRNA (cytidine(1402)-2'-O)-methyltransferase [uncultured Odoribacter sp.]
MGKLYLIPTPVGNLEDITLRALRILKEVSLVLAEDTRTTANLLKHYEIQTPLQSHHKFNEHQQVEKIAERLSKGEDIALVSDAGTPGISDPGFLLTKTCIEHGLETECLPGATAFVPALVNSGFPCDRFCFEGFLPQKKGRLKRLTALSEESRTLIFYESPYRLVKALQQMSEIFGPDRQACVAREISKLFEEFKRGSLQELIDYYTEKGVKGEIVIIVEGKKKEEGELYIETE